MGGAPPADTHPSPTLSGHVSPVVPSAPGWSEKLASDSEAVIKAERDNGAPAPGDEEAVEADVAKLQAHTLKVLIHEEFMDAHMEVEPETDDVKKGSSPL